MAQKLEKVLGKKETCRSCKNEIICGNATYQGETKLQWQNPDGKPHYKKNDDGSFTCKTITKVDTSQMKIDETDPTVMWTKDTYETELKIRNTLRKLMSGEPDAQHVGMYLKLRKEL